MKTIKEKLELGQGRMNILNEGIVFGNEESFIAYVDMYKLNSFDTSHYEQTYKKAKEYVREMKLNKVKERS